MNCANANRSMNPIREAVALAMAEREMISVRKRLRGRTRDPAIASRKVKEFWTIAACRNDSPIAD
jgi:hypothetical protein